MKTVLNSSDLSGFIENTCKIMGMDIDRISDEFALSAVGSLKNREIIKKGCSIAVFVGSGYKGIFGADISRISRYGSVAANVSIFMSEKMIDKDVICHVDLAKGYGCRVYKGIPKQISEYDHDIVIDALSDLSMPDGHDVFLKQASSIIHKMKGIKISLIIPYGIEKDSAEISECALKADITISPNPGSPALYLYPGCSMCGDILFTDTCLDNGRAADDVKDMIHIVESSKDIAMRPRVPFGNKGTFGKLLVIAGHKNVCGAAMLACRSAYRSGCGMVRLLTTESNRVIIQESIPEVILDTYPDDEDLYEDDKISDSDRYPVFNMHSEQITEKSLTRNLEKDIRWADRILIGPGLGTGASASSLVRSVSRITDRPIVFDADALNIISDNDDIRDEIRKNGNDHIIMTPHMGELSRLLGGIGIDEIKKDWISYVRRLSDDLGTVVVSKDARTLVTSPFSKDCYINIRGSSAMATAGSGDVLAGITAALSDEDTDPVISAVRSVMLHAEAGERASGDKCKEAVMAGDIAEDIIFDT